MLGHDIHGIGGVKGDAHNMLELILLERCRRVKSHRETILFARDIQKEITVFVARSTNGQGAAF